MSVRFTMYVQQLFLKIYFIICDNKNNVNVVDSINNYLLMVFAQITISLKIPICSHV